MNVFQKENLDVKENEPLAQYTSFKIGGPAKYFFVAKNSEEVIGAIQVAEKNKIPVHILGGGSNSLINDNGFDGLIIQIKNLKFKIKNSNTKSKIIEAEAGVLLGQLVSLASQESLTGLEWAIGIPGTIGGAVRGNAGAYGKSISEAVKSVQFINLKLTSPFRKGGMRGILTPKMKELNPSLSLPLRKGEDQFKIQNFGNKDCLFSYRDSIFKQDPNLIILEVELELKRGDSKKIKQEMKDIITKRVNKIPPFPSAGSFFKNIKIKNKNELPEKLLKQIPDKFFEIKTVPVAWLIEECGLKSKQIGGAKISDEHANFIINTGAAKAQDVIMLASLIKQQVRDKFGVQLEEEVELVGL